MFGSNRLKFYALVVVVFLACFFVVMSALNAETVTAVKIKSKNPAQEPRDKTLLGIGKDGQMPDYRIRLRADDHWQDLGTKPDQSAADWLEFPVRRNVPLRSAQEIELLEVDALANDRLDRVQIGAKPGSSVLYEYELVTAYRFETGLQWFLGTDVGKAIVFALIIVIVVIVVSNWS